MKIKLEKTKGVEPTVALSSSIESEINKIKTELKILEDRRRWANWRRK